MTLVPGLKWLMGLERDQQLRAMLTTVIRCPWPAVLRPGIKRQKSDLL